MRRRTGYLGVVDGRPSLRYIRDILVPFEWLGQTRRPLRKWLEENREVLKEECFDGRDSVKQRTQYLPLREEPAIVEFAARVGGIAARVGGIARGNREDGPRGLVWICGVGGSGKSALGMYLLRRLMVERGNLGDGGDVPMPVLVGEDWDGSLASHVARQLRHPEWTEGPSEAMAKVLGACGLLCPLVDSLSERSMEGALRLVGDAIGNGDFRHVIVTSREKRPEGMPWEAMIEITPGVLKRKHVGALWKMYAPGAHGPEVERHLEGVLGRDQMPSPLFLRFAIEQTAVGSAHGTDHMSLVLEYVETLRRGRIDIDRTGMLRAACTAAIEVIERNLRAQEISAEQLEWAVRKESNVEGFYTERERRELTPAELVGMLVESGLVARGRKTLQFTYDLVAEYLAAWRVRDDPRGTLAGLRERMESTGENAVAAAYRDIDG